MNAPANTRPAEIAGARDNEPPDDVADGRPKLLLAPLDRAAVSAIRSECGLGELAAQVLVRRGLNTTAAVSSWLGGGSLNDPEELPGAPAAAEVIAEHIRSGSRIAVHGDYDVDGVTSTAILVRALDRLGADVTWHVPSRFGDGYGLTRPSLERLIADGAQLVVAVDCGIGSVQEVEFAKQQGVDVVICDHHTAGRELPAAPIVHPALGDYPTPFLCAAATTFKLAQCVTRRLGAEEALIDEDLSLVALATVCDMVPLVGENRALVRAGIERMRSTQRPGLCELMRVAGVDQLRVTEAGFGFGLGPRINAAGRMRSAEPAVELLLTENRERAAELASALAAANDRRREVEREILNDAERQAREQRDKFAIVVAGLDWHPGVLGIVAGRLAEKYRRPAVALSIDDGVATGSGRSGGVYDLHGGLAACSEILLRFGGHTAAAGLALDVDDLPAFRTALAKHAAESLSADDLRPALTVDAITGAADLTLDSVDALAALGPFGSGNPEPLVLVVGAELVSVSRLGQSGQHFRLGIAQDGVRAQVVAFRQERAIAAPDAPEPAAFAVSLQRNEFNGRVEAQAVLRGLLRRLPEVPELPELRGADAAASHDWRGEFESTLISAPFDGGGLLDESAVDDRRGEGAVRVVLELLASGREGVVAVANDPARLKKTLSALTAADERIAAVAVRGFDDPSVAEAGYAHVVIAEPPPAPAFASFPKAQISLAWSDADVDRVVDAGGGLLLGRDHVVLAFRTIRDAADPGRAVGALEGRLPSARIAARAVQALEELGLVAVEREGDSVEAIKVVAGAKSDLDRSSVFRTYSGYEEDSELWLRQLSTRTTPR